jgi:hypothetical protein
MVAAARRGSLRRSIPLLICRDGARIYKRLAKYHIGVGWRQGEDLDSEFALSIYTNSNGEVPLSIAGLAQACVLGRSSLLSRMDCAGTNVSVDFA